MALNFYCEEWVSAATSSCDRIVVNVVGIVEKEEAKAKSLMDNLYNVLVC